MLRGCLLYSIITEFLIKLLWFVISLEMISETLVSCTLGLYMFDSSIFHWPNEIPWTTVVGHLHYQMLSFALDIDTLFNEIQINYIRMNYLHVIFKIKPILLMCVLYCVAILEGNLDKFSLYSQTINDCVAHIIS